jgi:acyl-CoA hydrolase
VDRTRLAQLLAELAPVPRVVAGGNAAVPWGLLDLVDRTAAGYRLFMLNAPAAIPEREGVVHETPFVGAGMRGSRRLRYLPARLSHVPLLLASTCPPDVVCVRTTEPRRGRVSLGVEVNVLPAAIEACRSRGGLVLAQFDPEMPFTLGEAELDVGVLDGVLLPADTDRAGSLTTLPASSADVDGANGPSRLGQLVADRVTDGSVLQLGIGRIPDAALARLVDRRRLYEWLDGNERVRFLRTETINDPARIAGNPRMTSINTALQVDLFAQVNASRIRSRIYSGLGGQTDFVVGALHAPQGQAVIALESWHRKADASAIIPLLDEPTSAFHHTAVVTEQGVAEIFGQDERTQARNLIECAAHPRVRDELWEEAAGLGLC